MLQTIVGLLVRAVCGLVASKAFFLFSYLFIILICDVSNRLNSYFMVALLSPPKVLCASYSFK